MLTLFTIGYQNLKSQFLKCEIYILLVILDLTLSYMHSKQYVHVYYGKIKILTNFMKLYIYQNIELWDFSHGGK